MDEGLQALVDFICLLYHEARNIRHPIRDGKLAALPKYARLLSLPNNKYEAWHHMAKVRAKAAEAVSVTDVAAAFSGEYRLTLDELLAIYRAPFWKGSVYGGNKWAPICSAVMSLAETLAARDDCRAGEFLEEILDMRHNTGAVRNKLHALKGGE